MIHYKEFKDSTMQWIGKVPSHWSELKLKYLLKDIRTGTTPSTENPNYYNGSIKWFTPGDFKETMFLNESARTVSHLAIEKNVINLLPEETVLIVGIGATLGKVAILSEESAFNQQITGLVANDFINHEFLYYWLKINKGAIFNTSSFTTLPIINNQFLKGFYSLVPPLKEQTSIINFLNAKTIEIDSLITDKEKLIALLEEKRQAVITEAVTKGLNPNVKMKDSGVEWIGEIPEHWVVKKIKHVTKHVGSGKTPRGGAEVYGTEGVIFIRSQNVYNDGLRMNDLVHIDECVDEEMKASRVLPKDTLLNITGASIGRTCLVPDNMPRANVNQHVCILRPRIEVIVPSILAKIVSSELVKGQILMSQNGSSREGINFSQIGNIDFPLSECKEEQKSISGFIEKQTNIFTEIILEVKQQIQKLNEYRQSLIYEAVTGKIDVREYVEKKE